MSGRPPRRLSRHDRVLLEAWSAELDGVEVPADLGGGLHPREAVAALVRVAIQRTAVEEDPGLAGVLLDALVACDAEYARLTGLAPDEIDPDGTELAAARLELAELLAAARDRGRWAPRRAAVLQWVGGCLGVSPGERRMVAAVATALDDTAGADPAAFGHALDARDVPGLLWLLAGLVALGGGGDVAWLGRLDDRDAR